jgi:hypothetical protein
VDDIDGFWFAVMVLFLTAFWTAVGILLYYWIT